MTPTNLSQDIFDRHPDLVEDDLSGGRAMHAHLLFFRPKLQAGKTALHQEGGEVNLVDLGENGQQVGKPGIGAELLGAVEDVVAAVRRQRHVVFAPRASEPAPGSVRQ